MACQAAGMLTPTESAPEWRRSLDQCAAAPANQLPVWEVAVPEPSISDLRKLGKRIVNSRSTPSVRSARDGISFAVLQEGDGDDTKSRLVGAARFPREPDVFAVAERWLASALHQEGTAMVKKSHRARALRVVSLLALACR